jgi:hypothetical protein
MSLHSWVVGCGYGTVETPGQFWYFTDLRLPTVRSQPLTWRQFTFVEPQVSQRMQDIVTIGGEHGLLRQGRVKHLPGTVFHAELTTRSTQVSNLSPETITIILGQVHDQAFY